MANKYSRYQLQPYVSQFVDPGSVQVAQVLRQRYDKNKQQYDMLDRSVNSINTLDGDRHLKEGAIKNVENSFSRTIEVGNFENAGRVISDATNDFVGNRGLQLAQQSYNARQQEMKVIDQLRANGKQVLDFNETRDPETGQIIGHKTDSHASYYQDPSSGKMVENVYRPGSEMMLDYTQRMESLLAGIAKSGGASKLTQADMAGFVKYMTSSGVSRTKAYDVVNKALESYIESDEGTQDLRRLTQIEGMSEQEAKMDMITRMQGVVEKQIGSISTPHYMKDPTGGSGGGSGAGNYSYKNGTILKSDTDIADYQDLIEEGAELRHEMSKLIKGSSEYNEKEKELQENKNNRAKMNKAAFQLEENKSYKNSYDQGQNILGTKYAKLEEIFHQATTDNDWNLLYDFGGEMSDLTYSLFGWRMTDELNNVSSITTSEYYEKKDLLRQLGKDDAIERINKLSGLNLKEADKAELLKVAGEYYDWMKGRGNYENLSKSKTHGDEVYDKVEEFATIADTDMYVFSYEGTKELRDVNTSLTQYEMDDFNFEFNNDEEMMEVKKAFDDVKGWDKGDHDGKAQSIIQFEGMTIPSKTEPSRIALNINGTRYFVTPKQGQVRNTLVNEIYSALGVDPKNHMVDEMGRQYKNGELNNATLFDFQANTTYNNFQQGLLTEEDYIAEMEKIEVSQQILMSKIFDIPLIDLQNMQQNDEAKYMEYLNDVRRMTYQEGL